MNKSLALLLGSLSLAAVGCSDDGPTTVAVAPQALVRWVNASPDSPLLTARFVDQVENTRDFFDVGFRGSSRRYVSVNAGERTFRVFRSSSTIETAQTVVFDTTFTMAEGGRYTIVQVGRATLADGTAGAARAFIFTDTLPDAVPAGSIALRTYHVAEGTANVDAYITPSTATGTTGAVVTATNVPFGWRTAYATVPALAGADTVPVYRWAITPTGSQTVAIAASPQVRGTAAVAASTNGPAQNPTAGVRQPLSVLSAFVLPAAVAGSSATAGAATVILLPDRAPPMQ